MRGDASSELDGPANNEGGASCAVNQDCSGIPFNVCDITARTCKSLATAECPEVLGNYLDPNALLLGAILPVAIDSPPPYLTGLTETGSSIRAGLALAVDEFGSEKNPYKGLPPTPGSSTTRPIAVVVCSDGHSATTTAAATAHLALDLGVPAIIGSAFPTYSRAIVSRLASLQKSDVLVMTPRSSDFTPPDNAGNYTRLTPSDDVQGAALAALVASREPAIRAAMGDGGAAPIKVTVVYKSDAYGTAVVAAFKKAIRFNGGETGTSPNYAEYKYGNPDAPDFAGSFSSTGSAAASSKPNALVFIGTNEIISTLLSSIESTPLPNRPFYFLSDGVAVPELWDFLAKSDTSDSARKRILGTISLGTATRYGAFAAAYTAKSPQQSPIVSGAATSYDAFYMLAYSAAGLGLRAITGPNLLDGFGLLQQAGGALQVPVGPDALGATLDKLSGGEGINLDGASGPLTFDTTSRTAVGTTTQVWCVPTAAGHAAPAILSGQTIDASNTVQGTLSSACGL